MWGDTAAPQSSPPPRRAVTSDSSGSGSSAAPPDDARKGGTGAHRTRVQARTYAELAAAERHRAEATLAPRTRGSGTVGEAGSAEGERSHGEAARTTPARGRGGDGLPPPMAPSTAALSNATGGEDADDDANASSPRALEERGTMTEPPDRSDRSVNALPLPAPPSQGTFRMCPWRLVAGGNPSAVIRFRL